MAARRRQQRRVCLPRSKVQRAPVASERKLETTTRKSSMHLREKDRSLSRSYHAVPTGGHNCAQAALTSARSQSVTVALVMLPRAARTLFRLRRRGHARHGVPQAIRVVIAWRRVEPRAL